MAGAACPTRPAKAKSANTTLVKKDFDMTLRSYE